MVMNDARIAVVGGTGRMGSWIADLLERRGHRVLRTGRGTDPRPEEAARACRVVIVSVPVQRTIEVIRCVAPCVREDGLLMDLTSIKQAPLHAMLELSRAEVVGLHPLFGPKADPADGPLTVALCPGRGKRGLRWIAGVLRSEGYFVDRIEASEHDRIMGVVQGVNHFATLALALCLSRSGVPLEALERWSTPSFRLALDRIRALLSQPDHLFQALLTGTPAARSGMERYRLAVKELESAAACGENARFQDLFLGLEKAFGTRGGAAGQPNDAGSPSLESSTR